MPTMTSVAAAVLAVAAGLSGGSTVQSSPLRYVTTGNQFAQTTKTFTGALLGNAYKDIHYIGSGTVNSLYVEFNNVALGQSTFNDFTVPELWITIDGQSTGYQVTFSGATSWTVVAGSIRFRSDPIPIASIPGSGGSTLARGTKLWVGGRTEAVVNAIIPGIIIRNIGTNQALQYTPGSTTINNLAGSTAMTGTPGGGTQATANQGYGLPTLTGTFVGGDQFVYMPYGDSITMGYFSNAQTISYGASYRALFDNFATFSNPRAGIVVAQVGSSAPVWNGNSTVRNCLAAVCKGANRFLGRYGINTIINDGGSGGAATLITALKTNCWDLIRANSNTFPGALTPVIYQFPLLPHTSGPAVTALVGTGVTATVTTTAAFITSLGAGLSGCGIVGATPSGFNGSNVNNNSVTLTPATATTATYPNATSGTATVNGTVNDGFITTTNQTPNAGNAQGQEQDFVNSQLAALAGTGANGPDFYYEDTAGMRSDPNSANSGYFIYAAGVSVDGLHPNDTTGYITIAANQRMLMQAMV